MKICFLMQRRFAYVAHAMAMVFKQKYGVEEFCGYVSTRQSYEFLLRQKDINYTKLTLEEDVYASYAKEKVDGEYLKLLEKEYGMPNLWPYVALDRVLMYSLLLRAYPSDTPKYNHEELIRIFQAMARTATDFLEKERPGVIVFSVVANLSSLFLFHAAKKMGIKTIIFDAARSGVRYMVSEFYDRNNFLEQTYEKILKNDLSEQEKSTFSKKREEAVAFLRHFQESQPYYGDSSGAPVSFKDKTFRRNDWIKFIAPGKFFSSLSWYAKDFFNYFFGNQKKDYTTIKPWYAVWDKLVSKLRVLFYPVKIFDEIKQEDFVYFSLHAEPEALPMLTAPFYTDQLWLIKQVARSLPLSYKLYVKEHPAMVAFRPKRFYKQLKKIPNVKLIHPSLPGTELIKKCQLVVTVSGSAAFEGALLKKPAVVFGSEFFNSLSAIKRCVCIEDLPRLIKHQLDEFVYNEKEMKDFLTAVFVESVNFDAIKIWDFEGDSNMEEKKNAVSAMVDLIARKLDINGAVRS